MVEQTAERRQSTPFMLGRNKGIRVGGSYHRALILLPLSKADPNMARRLKELKVSLSCIKVLIYLIACSGCRIVQVRVVFQIPRRWVHDVAPLLDTSLPTHLAYVEWFTPITSSPDPRHQMHRVSRQIQDGCRCASIIPVDWIRRSIHLLPQFGPVVPQGCNSFTVLDKCNTFYINPFSDVDNYLSFM